MEGAEELCVEFLSEKVKQLAGRERIGSGEKGNPGNMRGANLLLFQRLSQSVKAQSLLSIYQTSGVNLSLLHGLRTLGSISGFWFSEVCRGADISVVSKGNG